ncbi:phospholipase D family protein [Ideonella sp. BN130291]|uniref:phospholipase D family protein n=1 Tax=Ideonella sp. BN130291 TaxID=3112940 RepID=UPI002E268CBC|nr:phospholipase D family protein [Ideonella sp. BN130291]
MGETMSMAGGRKAAWRAMGRGAVACLGLLAGLLLAGCATPLPRVDRDAIASTAIELSTGTTLGRIAKESQPDPALSGFRLMPLGSFSLDTRVQLARRAEASLDVQYYHIENDETGRWLLRALRDAAERGVRVRLLVDDYYTSGEDELFLGLAAYRNVEVRIFNPFCCARDSGQNTRFLVSLNDFGRVNHRMHNKLFIADGAMAVIGGRNVANEYYLRGMNDNFIDLDAFTVGWVIPPLQALFDRYWNSDPVYPLHAVAHSPLSPEELRARFERATGPAHTPEPEPLPSNDILGYGPIADDLDGGRLGLIWGDAYVFADHPDKPFEGEVGGELLETSVTYNVFEAIRKAKKSLLASSPYFVPGPHGMELLRELRGRGVDVTVLTNSLGSTDEPVVHLGYSRYREEMLRMGVHLYELSSSRVKTNKRMFLFGKSLGRLHAKLVVIDRGTCFVGSMNLDPRSATINTELGAVIRSPQLARELTRVIDIDRLQSAYMVRIKANGAGLEWITEGEDAEMVLDTEPDSSPWLRFKQWLLSPFVPESLL